MNELLEAGGALAYLIVGIAGIGVVGTLGLAAVGFSKRRVPLAIFFALPVFLTGVGAFGSWSHAGVVLADLQGAEAHLVPGMAMTGLMDAIATDWFARWGAACLFVVAAWVASVGAIAAGDDTRMTPFSGAAAVIMTVVGGGLCAFYAIRHGLGREAMTLVGLLVIGGLGVAIGSFRRALDEQAHRVAGMRFASSICMVMAVSMGGRAMVIGAEMQAFGPEGVAAQADNLLAAIAIWGEVASPVLIMSWMVFGVSLFIAFFGFYNELGEVVERYTLIDVFACVAMVGMVGVMQLMEYQRTEALSHIGTNGPAVAMFDKFGGDLTPALLSIDKEVREAVPRGGGFGDVLAWIKEGDDGQFVRVFKWNGTGWDPDETPASKAKLHERMPLLAAPNGEPAAAVLEVAKGTADGKVLLLLRASEVKSDVTVPLELGHLQVTYMELQVGDERDLEKDVWTKAGARNYMWGPIIWFGEDEKEEPLKYANAVAEDTGAKLLHVLVGERHRVKDLVNSCLPFMMDLEGDSAVTSEDRTCLYSADDPMEVRDAAAEVWPLPESETLAMTTSKIEGDQLAEDDVDQRFRHELAAIEFCVNVLKEEGEEAEGELKLEAKINSKGKVGDLQIHEKSKVQSQPVARCVGQRFKDIEFEMPEPPERVEGEEPPPLPKYEVNLDFKG